jgi:hypothetical protein
MCFAGKTRPLSQGESSFGVNRHYLDVMTCALSLIGQ